ncbi:MAG: EF2563 family selenium-dependent molybdenum hydroxylase system protein [Candidatus Eisenbacteria bacterium]|nr:EF2563 family selenium-dependent molybdenum hydroxylase system protein [Candidatus Eisenbacteria bacterium]
MSKETLVVVRGGGDLGTGVAHALVSAGYRVVILEAERPRVVRRKAAFAEAVYAEHVTVEGIAAVKAKPVVSEVRRLLRVSLDEASSVQPVSVEEGTSLPCVPVVVDPEGRLLRELRPTAIVDARMAKRNLGGPRAGALLTVALGPGFEAGHDADIVIETMRGPSLGNLIERGRALPDTGVPGVVGGASADRLIRSPADGVFRASARIGDLVAEGQTVGDVAGIPVKTSLAGLLRGLVVDGLEVAAGEKMGDVDPRGAVIDPSAISDKAGKIGKSVLAALISRGLESTTPRE